MKHLKKLIALICALCLIFGVLSGCSSEKVDTEEYDLNAEMSNIESGVVAENDNFVLNWVKDRAVVTVTSKKDGTVWSSTPVDYLNSSTVNDFLGRELINSLLSITCRKAEQSFTYYASTSCIQNGRFSSEKIDNGLRVTFYFDEIELIAGLDIYLEDDAFKVKVDPEKIKYYGDNHVVNVTPVPFMCSSKNTEAGNQNEYLVIPSGSGAIMYTDLRSDGALRTFESDMYGSDPSVSKYESSYREIALTMPFYGIKNSKSALCAIIESGAESTGIIAKAGDNVEGYSYINAYYNTLGYEKIYATGNHRTQYNDKQEANLEPLVIGYYALNGDDANYTGMAKKYRSYLTKKEGMEKSQDNSLLTVKLIGSYVEDDLFLGIPTDKNVSLTSYEEAEKILSELKSISGGSLVADMYGYGEGGINGYTVNGGEKLTGVCGNKKSLNNFVEFTNKESIKTFFNFNPVIFAESAGGYSINKDSAVSAIGIAASIKQFLYSNGTEYDKANGGIVNVMVSRSLLEKSVSEAVAVADKYGISGVAFDTLGNYCYSDYNKDGDNMERYYPLKTKMGSQVSSIINKIGDESSKTVLIDSGYAYAAASADIVTGVPTTSELRLAFDRDVPLYQIVFQGTKSLSVSPINMAVNHRTQFLKAIESGSGLSYTLIANYDNELRKQYMRGLNTSVYSDNKAEIESYVEESKDFLNKVAGSTIKYHTYLTDDVTNTVFENGVSVVVNFGEKDYNSEATGLVKAMGFVVK